MTKLIDWYALKRLGWPYSRAHTERKMQETIELSRKDKRTGEREFWSIPNPDPFPKAIKLGAFPNSPRVWEFAKVADYFSRHGIEVTLEDLAP
jgi:hypothetical protein